MIRLRMEIIGEPLWMRHWTSGSISHAVIVKLFIKTMDIWKKNLYLPMVTWLLPYLQFFLSSACSFRYQYVLLFLKYLRSWVLLFPTPFTCIISPSTGHEKGNFVLGYYQSSRFFSPMLSRTSSLVPNRSPSIFVVFRIMNHTIQCFL